MTELLRYDDSYGKGVIRADDGDLCQFDDVQEIIAAMQKRIDELNVAAKRAFWWSAEFTANSHDNKIADAWEEFLTHPHAAPLDGAEP